MPFKLSGNPCISAARAAIGLVHPATVAAATLAAASSRQHCHVTCTIADTAMLLSAVLAGRGTGLVSSSLLLPPVALLSLPGAQQLTPSHLRADQEPGRDEQQQPPVFGAPFT